MVAEAVTIEVLMNRLSARVSTTTKIFLKLHHRLVKLEIISKFANEVVMKEMIVGWNTEYISTNIKR